ncbi:hypothetical protein HELRODRAFT_111560 [Helobdella robusta]|uniref:Alpha-galactosidase n=1 Tax=Helobdella robusta TaxID=6412 RepID=T1EFC5_HELRO|nr:hypothetical protein HELRODRAFT_111560 [Helobdella robusta]ESO05122.1 hypothetical protein HELRODRAFT_111560 [Helobdella robusta]
MFIYFANYQVILFSSFVTLISLSSISSIQDGQVRTPPMGWLSWERFRCTTDCSAYPDDCISDKLLRQMADHLAADGFVKAGYNHVIVDDCWLAKTRDVKGRLQPDAARFPQGMKPLADYIHSKGLKFGLYEDVGAKTCAGYPGSEHYFQLDAQTFADWTVDYLKFDGCNYHPSQYQFGYPNMNFFLNMTGRQIVLSCEYALYEKSFQKPNYTAQAQVCHLSRNFDDIDDSWDSLLSIIKFYGENNGDFAAVAGPGYFNDPDMLIIGNFGLSPDQERVQMAVWCILAAPLMISNDLRKIRKSSKDLLLNKMAIAVNQDELGVQGRRVNMIGNVEIWSKPILPAGSYAFAFVNRNTGVPTKITLSLTQYTEQFWLKENTNQKVKELLSNAPAVVAYNVTEIFENIYEGVFKPRQSFTKFVNPTGAYFAIATAIYQPK